jgi:hypothetical protein
MKEDSKTKVLIIGDSQAGKISEAIRSACDKEIEILIVANSDDEIFLPRRRKLEQVDEVIKLTKELKYSPFEHKSKFHK